MLSYKGGQQEHKCTYVGDGTNNVNAVLELREAVGHDRVLLASARGCNLLDLSRLEMCCGVALSHGHMSSAGCNVPVKW